MHFLTSQQEDPEVDTAIKRYMRAAYQDKAAPEKPEEKLELSSKVERKYIAAQIVEQGIQVGQLRGLGLRAPRSCNNAGGSDGNCFLIVAEHRCARGLEQGGQSGCSQALLRPAAQPGGKGGLPQVVRLLSGHVWSIEGKHDADWTSC